MTTRTLGAGFSLLMTMVLISNASAQTSTGVVVGRVLDSSGAIVPNASVTLVNKATNVALSTTTSESGTFRFPVVAIGDHRITAESAGFLKATLDNLTVTVGQSTSAELVLQVSGQAQTVEVAGGTISTIQTESSQVQTVVPQQEVENLPLNGRNFIQLVALQPNAVPNLRTSNTANRGGYNTVGGAPVPATSITIDGVNIREIVDPRTTVLLNPDLIEEFQSASQNYSAGQGGAGGAQVNLVTKAGTNRYHGGAYEFVRNDKLNARNFFDPQIKPLYRQNQFGATFGGKIIRDKLFFFSGYEGLRIAQSLTQLFTVPTVANRQGNFQANPQIYNPLSYNASTGLRDPFGNNIIPDSMISPVAAKAIQILFPLPNLPGGIGDANNLTGSKPNRQKRDQYSIRGDYTPTDKGSIFARYIYYNPRILTGANAALPNFADNQDTPAHNAALGYTRTLTPKLVNQARLGYFRFTQVLGDVQIDVPINQQIGITGTSTEFLGNPNISITGISRTGAISNAPNNRVDDAYYLYDDLLFNSGRHGLSMGFNVALEQNNGGANPNARGSFTFTNQYTQQIGKATTGFAFADFLLGYPATSAVGLGTGFRNWRQDKYALYVQDDWKATSNLTVNIGLRYEYTQPQYELRNNVSGFDVKTGKVVQLGTNGIPRGLRSPYRKDFEPRVGTAYRPWGSKRTVIRAGYGITFIPLTFLSPAFAMGSNPPNYVAETFTGTTPIPNLTLGNAFPAGLGTVSTTLSTIAQNFRDAYLQQWNLGIERELAKKITMEVGYVANKGSRLSYTQDINASPAGPGNIQAKRPYSAFGSISSLDSFAASTYESMVVKSQRRFSGGLVFLASYTWAKSLVTPNQSIVGDGASSTSVRDPLNPGADKGRDVFDIRQRLVGSTVWDLPFGRGHRIGGSWSGFVDQLLGGWGVNTILTLMTGYPLTPALGLDNANTGNTSQDRPDTIHNPNNGLRTVQQWFDTSAFVLPAKFSYGNAGTNIIDGPPTRTLDLSLTKKWRITETATLQFRTDVFNVTNTAQFNQPGATFGTSTFGVISSAGDPRELQFALKLAF